MSYATIPAWLIGTLPTVQASHIALCQNVFCLHAKLYALLKPADLHDTRLMVIHKMLGICRVRYRHPMPSI